MKIYITRLLLFLWVKSDSWKIKLFGMIRYEDYFLARYIFTKNLYSILRIKGFEHDLCLP